ncbi:hypothetical protein IW262DRAFT_1291161 [Armillaria fumosa]|nr:hypothetical protein IW262DRAFT_1291161 [Armillaria fumosa]
MKSDFESAAGILTIWPTTSFCPIACRSPYPKAGTIHPSMSSYCSSGQSNEKDGCLQVTLELHHSLQNTSTAMRSQMNDWADSETLTLKILTIHHPVGSGNCDQSVNQMFKQHIMAILHHFPALRSSPQCPLLEHHCQRGGNEKHTAKDSARHSRVIVDRGGCLGDDCNGGKYSEGGVLVVIFDLLELFRTGFKSCFLTMCTTVQCT